MDKKTLDMHYTTILKMEEQEVISHFWSSLEEKITSTLETAHKASVNTAKKQMTAIVDGNIKIIAKLVGYNIRSDMVHHVDSKVDYLKQNTSKLKALFLQHESKLEKLIDLRKEDINQFFTLAGFPYEFGLKKDGEKN